MTSIDLINRLTILAKDCQKLYNKLPKTDYNIVYGNQLIRSSASPGSNYIEALEASSSKDFCYRLKVCRKEIKESEYWLSLIQSSNSELKDINDTTEDLINEAKELVRIFTSSILTSEKNQKNRK